LQQDGLTNVLAGSQQVIAVREMDLLRARVAALAKKNHGKDRVIVELQEGERILEVSKANNG